MTKKSSKTKGKINKIAIVAFVLSILGMLGIGLGALIGFFLGINALTQIKYTKEGGRGLAIAAIVIGFIYSFGIAFLQRMADMGL